jgi:hypothetical protein
MPPAMDEDGASVTLSYAKSKYYDVALFIFRFRNEAVLSVFDPESCVIPVEKGQSRLFHCRNLNRKR